MSDSEYEPYSSPLPIPGTSYMVQIGKQKSSDKWQVRIVKGREIISERVLDDPELNGNTIIGFIMQELAIPMINPYQISKTVKILIKQGERGPLAARTMAPSPPMPGTEGEAPAKPTAPPPAESTPKVSPTSEYDSLIEPRSKPAPPPTTSKTSRAVGDCPRCKSPIEDHFYFCPICSKQLKEKHCPGCNKEIRPDYELCPYCGIKLN